MNKYTDFLEKHMGEIQYGWTSDESNQKLPFQIVKYAGGPFSGTVSFSTLGLSNEELTSSVSGKQNRQFLRKYELNKHHEPFPVNFHSY